MDLVNAEDDIILKPLHRALVPSGIRISVPRGYELQIRPRSGLAVKSGITVLNTPGTVDATYRGEIKVVLYNADPVNDVCIAHGDRIAQAVLNKVEEIEWEECDGLDDTERGHGGFGSTGIGKHRSGH